MCLIDLLYQAICKGIELLMDMHIKPLQHFFTFLIFQIKFLDFKSENEIDILMDKKKKQLERGVGNHSAAETTP